MKKRSLFFFVLVLTVVGQKHLASQPKDEVVLFSFESEQEISHWQINTTALKKTASFATLGDFGARIVFHKYESHTSKWPNITNDNLPQTDWGPYGYLIVSLENPQDDVISLGVRIDDSADKRFSRHFELPPKDREDLVIDLSKTDLDLAKIKLINFFITTPAFETELLIDNIRLSRKFPLEISQVDIIKTPGFDRRVKISAQSQVNCDWKLTILDDENDELVQIDYLSSQSPRWIYTFDAKGRYQILITASAGTDSIATEAGVSVTEEDKKRAWVWASPPTDRTDLYRMAFPETIDTIVILMADNETEGFQIPFVTNFGCSLNVRLDIQTMNVYKFRVGSLNLKSRRSVYRPGKDGWTNDVLHKFEHGFRATAGVIETVYLEVSKNSTDPGARIIEENITMNFGTINVMIPVKIIVYPLTLSNKDKIKTAFSYDLGALKSLYKDETVNLVDLLLLLKEHGLTPEALYRKEPITPQEIDNISDIVDQTWTNIVHIRENGTGYLSPGTLSHKLPAIKSAVDYVRQNNLQDQYYFYVFDESRSESFSQMKEVVSTLNELFPEIPILSTAPFHQYPALASQLPEIDYWCPLTSAFFDFSLSKDYKWWYICLVPGHPYANWVLEADLMESRLIFWQAFQCDIEGFLYYNVNRWHSNTTKIKTADFPYLSWNPQSYKDFNGDGNLVYAGTDHILPSLRLKNIRDGIEDYMLFKLAEKKIGKSTIKKWISEISRNVKDFDRDSEKLFTIRRQILENVCK